MRSHLAILKTLLREKGLTQKDVAIALGYQSPSAVGMMLRGERAMAREVLEKACDLAGITLVALADMSNDLHLTQHAEAVEAAAILDDMTPEERAAVMPLLRSYRKHKGDR
jgi:transcriptional regulator with XRE-family HTH domain